MPLPMVVSERSVVNESVTRAGTALRSIQNETHEIITIRAEIQERRLEETNSRMTAKMAKSNVHVGM